MSGQLVVRNLSIPRAAVALLLWIVLCGIVFWPAFYSAIRVWAVSPTFHHCFFVLPVAFFIAWQDRRELLSIPVRPSYYVFVLVAISILIWGLGYAGKIAVLSHIAVFSMLALGVWMILGNRAARRLWFPLSFSLLAIPLGDELVPLFQEVTAGISVWLLRLSGVPVYHEGLYITLPDGRFKVAEACSGVRFFIASVCFALVFSYLSYQSTKKRVLYLIFALFLPVVANGLRAYGIIMLGYFSGMKHAVGADHLIYGWFFFALVLIIMYAVGSIWADEGVISQTEKRLGSTIDVAWNYNYKARVFAVIFIPFVIVACWKYIVDARFDSNSLVSQLPAPEFLAESAEAVSWQPLFSMATDEVRGGLGDKVELYIAWYSGDNRDAELIHYDNSITGHEDGDLIFTVEQPMSFGNVHITGTWVEIRSNLRSNRMIYYYFRVPGASTSNKIEAKLRQALSVFIGGLGEGALVAVSVESDKLASEQRALLEMKIKESYSEIDQWLGIY